MREVFRLSPYFLLYSRSNSLGSLRYTVENSARELFVPNSSKDAFKAGWRLVLFRQSPWQRRLTFLHRQAPVLVFYPVEWVPPPALLLEGAPFGAQIALSGVSDPRWFVSPSSIYPPRGSDEASESPIAYFQYLPQPSRHSLCPLRVPLMSPLSSPTLQQLPRLGRSSSDFDDQLRGVLYGIYMCNVYRTLMAMIWCGTFNLRYTEPPPTVVLPPCS